MLDSIEMNSCFPRLHIIYKICFKITLTYSSQTTYFFVFEQGKQMRRYDLPTVVLGDRTWQQRKQLNRIQRILRTHAVIFPLDFLDKHSI